MSLESLEVHSFDGVVVISTNQDLSTEKDSIDIKSFSIKNKDQEETNEETKGTKEPKSNISNYSEVVNKIKQLAVFTLEEGEFVGFNL